jgi:hypothetical protein
MSIYREDYYAEHCPFPLAFVQRDSKWLLIHATQWNRLDVSDPATGELLTDRPLPQVETGKSRPKHDLDYLWKDRCYRQQHRFRTLLPAVRFHGRTQPWVVCCTSTGQD